MADVIFITHFILLLTLQISKGERLQGALQEDDNVLESQEDFKLPELLDPNFNNGQMRPHFKCLQCDDEVDCEKPKFCEDGLSCWKSRVKEVGGKERVGRGCSNNPDHLLLTCNKSQFASKPENGKAVGGQYHVECCSADLCNAGPFPELQDLTSSDDEESFFMKPSIEFLASVVVLSVIIGGAVFYLLSHRSRQKRPKKTSRCNKLLMDADIDAGLLHFTSQSPTSGTNYHPHELKATAAGDSTLKEYLDGRSLTSGSGSGLPLLVQRTLAKQVTLVERLENGSNGSFGGEVWRGVWHGECVAVKIYFSRDEAAWARETEVYSQLLPRHDNILGYIGSDMTSKGSCTGLWLVTHYHPLGSLYDYLNRSPHPLTHHQTFAICLNIVNGLLYLHTEIHGTKGRTAIAHRNLKSKNILMKTSGACVISDFALAVTQDRLSREKVDVRQGTRRYMSPEILDMTLNPECLESFRRADIYSLGLILWEVCSRCISNGVVSDYVRPYSEWLGNQEPSIEEMRKLVCLDQMRPPVPNRWHSDEALTGLGKLMKECWNAKPAARLPILRVKKTLLKLASNDQRVNLTLD